jgi:hypothetical protein
LTGSGVLAMTGLDFFFLIGYTGFDILELDILTPKKVEMTCKMKVVS